MFLIYYKYYFYFSWNKKNLIIRIFKYLSVGKYGFLGVNSNNKIYFRNNVSLSNPYSDGWMKIDELLKCISVSEYGVWSVNSKDEIFYRNGLNFWS